MKHFLLTCSLLLVFTLTQTTLSAQSKPVTDTVTISGNCGECKDRIEEAAYIKGVKSAKWDKTSKLLTVTYNNEKTTLDKIELAIAKAGHDTPNHKSTDKTYQKLPACCAYRIPGGEHD